MVPIEAHHCYVDLSNGIVSTGGTATWAVVQHNPYIQHVRNRLVAEFLKTDCTDLLFIDDDISWEAGAAARLLSHDCDVVGGVYPMRADKLEFPCCPVDDPPIPDANGLIEVEYLPTGFMRIKRHVIEKMVERYKHLAYNEGNTTGCYALFWLDLVPDPQDHGKLKLMGEDVSFCRKWIDIGGKCHADTLLAFRHHGMKQWHARFAEHIPGYLQKEDTDWSDVA
jgi:hypothetical protein